MDREEEELKKLLKEKINHQVELTLHSETKDKELGNMSPTVKPHIIDKEYLIIFLGIYGINGRPLYMYGIDQEDSKNKLYRNNIDIWVDEDTGNPTHERCTTLLRLDDIDIKRWFSHGIFLEDESKLKEKIITAEPDAKYLAEKILKGKSDYWPGTYSPSWSVFDDTEFIGKVLNYLERVV